MPSIPYNRNERQDIMGLLEALQGGLNPNTGMSLYSGIQNDYGQRVDARQQRLADVRQAQQGALGGLQQFILQAAQQGVPSDVLASMVQQQIHQVPGIDKNPGLLEQLQYGVKDFFGEAYPDPNAPSPMSPIGQQGQQMALEASMAGSGAGQDGQLFNTFDDQDATAVRTIVEQATQRGIDKATIEQSLLSQLATAGITDPIVTQTVHQIVENTYGRVQSQMPHDTSYGFWDWLNPTAAR